MNFWDLADAPNSSAIATDGGVTLDRESLAARADSIAEMLAPLGGRTLGFITLDASVDSIAAYLGALRSRKHVPVLLQSHIDKELLDSLISQYKPQWLFTGSEFQTSEAFKRIDAGADHVIHWRDTGPDDAVPHPDLALLLTTSGSTGSEKLVRISYAALADNARAIAEYLSLRPDDRAVTTLPLAYSFGLSILNSHLFAGASILLTALTPLSRGFWDLVVDGGVTSLSGVPSSFQMLRRAGLEKRELGSLRMLTQAGGHLSNDLVRHFDEICRGRGLEFFVMYGQTEASPRISYVPSDRLKDKVGSIGIPIPGGDLSIDPENEELIYRGANVMMGYAEAPEDLAKDDECRGTLRTGDLAESDEDGFFFLKGRLKRFIKISGARVNLDHLEKQLTGYFQSSVVCTGSDDALHIAQRTDASAPEADLLAYLRSTFNIDRGFVKIHGVDEVPLTSNGKVDYRTLGEQLSK